MPRTIAARVWKTLTLLLAALGASLLVTTSASAQGSDDERARAHFEAGRSYLAQARYEDAAEQFEEAYRLSRRPEMLMNASTAFERALRFDEAIAALEQYIEVQPDASQRATLDERLRRLRELRDRLAATSPAAEPDARAAEPEEQPVEPDAHPIEPVVVVAPEAAPGADGGLGDLAVVGIALGGAGVVALVVSLATGIIAHDTHQTLQSRCGPDGRACPSGSQADIDGGSALAVTSTITLFGGLALLGAGIALLAVDVAGSASDSGEDDHARVRIGPGPGLAGVALEGSF